MERQWHKEHAGEGLIGDWGRGTHIKYDAHVCDFGRVKAQRLIERGRPLPSQKAEHTRREARRWERAAVGSSACSSVQVRARMGIWNRVYTGHARSAR